MNHEIQGIEYSNADYEAMRLEEEEYAKKFSEEYKLKMYADWTREPQESDLIDVLGSFKRTLRDYGQTVESVVAEEPFSPARYINTMQILVKAANLKDAEICPICNTPMRFRRSVYGRRDSGLRCAFNSSHLVIDMFIDNFSQEELDRIFGGTWLKHICFRGTINPIQEHYETLPKKGMVLKPVW